VKAVTPKAKVKEYSVSEVTKSSKSAKSPKKISKKVKPDNKMRSKRASSSEVEDTEKYLPPPKRSTRESDQHQRLQEESSLKPGDIVALECHDKDYDFYLMMLTEAPFTSRRQVSDDYGCTFGQDLRLIRGRYLEKVGKDRYVYKVEPKSTAYAHIKEIIAVVPMEIIQASRNMCYYLLDRDIYIAILQQM